MSENRILLEYLSSTLGVQYLALAEKASMAERADESPTATAEKKLGEWQHPGFTPRLVFLNFDQDDETLESEQKEIFEKIIKAMNLDLQQVWKVEAGQSHFGNILNRLSDLKINSPVVVLKKEPEIFAQLQRTGTHVWAECYSISSMLANPNLKKETWKVLQYFLKRKD